MEYSNDRDFKYVLQDASHVYLGGRMTFKEMMDWEDVPFKLKAIVNKYFLEQEVDADSLAGAFKVMDKKTFTYQICKQLRIKIKAGFYTVKVNRKGEEEKIYKSKTYSLDEYLALLSEGAEPITEEVSLSKLALLAFSV